MRHYIYIFILSLYILSLYHCSGCQTKTETVESITDINNVTPKQTFDVLYSEVEDTCQTSVVAEKPQPPKPTNEGEKKADEKKKEKIDDDLAKSKYSSCDEILKDYQYIINELRSGNLKPLKDFPIDSDPKIAICKSIDKNFAIQLDSMQKLSNQILDDL